MSEEMEKLQPIHSAIEISIDNNYTTAFMTITPPKNGGLEMTVMKATAEIMRKNISFGLDKAAIKDAVDNKRYNENIRIAYWKAPVDGVDGSIEYLFSRNTTNMPTEDEHGVVDYKNLGIVRNIYKGTLIARIHMPTEGEPGKDVAGRVVKQRVGVPAKVNVGKGTVLNADGTEITAEIDGNLRFANGAFQVDETLVIDGDVDVSVGNIDFIGNVIIKGNVFEGFKVASARNINAHGTVTGAELSAQGDITVKIGIIKTTVNCEGNVKIGFCENCKIHCENNVEAGSFISSEVYAGGAIRATGSKGIIVGGKYTALENIEASAIGSESYAKTSITLGNNAVLSEERDNLLHQITEHEEKLDGIEKILVTLGEMAKKGKLPPEREQMKVEVMKSKFHLQGEIKRMKTKIVEIEASLERKQNLSITCRRAFYPGVLLRINSAVYAVNTVCPHCRARIHDTEIEMIPL